MNKFLKEFKDRGYFYQCTDENELSSILDKKKYFPWFFLSYQVNLTFIKLIL